MAYRGFDCVVVHCTGLSTSLGPFIPTINLKGRYSPRVSSPPPARDRALSPTCRHSPGPNVVASPQLPSVPGPRPRTRTSTLYAVHSCYQWRLSGPSTRAMLLKGEILLAGARRTAQPPTRPSPNLGFTLHTHLNLDPSYRVHRGVVAAAPSPGPRSNPTLAWAENFRSGLSCWGGVGS